ncbi:MAG TPA: PKD domain-containing protein [Verrucomicrobiae bacterium]|nr:PKD domain-containing protein [Verrucomicrobiae bacterium]
MQIVKRLLNHLRLAASNKALVFGAIAVVTGGVLALNAASGATTANAAKCNPSNDIINCGAHSVQEFVNKYNENATGDLHNVYAHYGLSPDELGRFAATAKMGTAFKDGRIEVDGQTVATGAHSLGRSTLGGQNRTPVTIAGKTYYFGPSQANFGSNAIPVIVMMNPDTHEMEFASLTVCGNPIWGNSPKYKCDSLQKEQIDRTTFKFSTNVVAENGATVSRVVYEFGDGTTETRTNPSEAVTHKYAKAGNYNAKVTVYFNVNGKEVSDTRQSCETPVEVKPEPIFECSALTAKQLNRNEYEFTAHTKAEGATLISGNFEFGDGASQNDVKPDATDPTTVVTTHKYAKEGNYTIKATVSFESEGKVTSKACEVSIKVSPEACPLNPQLPVNHPDCKPCPYNPELPVGHPDCEKPAAPKPPVELPKTGPADFIGGAFGLGSITAAGAYYLRSRKHLIDRLLNK